MKPINRVYSRYTAHMDGEMHTDFLWERLDSKGRRYYLIAPSLFAPKRRIKKNWLDFSEWRLERTIYCLTLRGFCL